RSRCPPSTCARVTVGETRLLTSPGTPFRSLRLRSGADRTCVVRLITGPSRKAHPRVLLAGESSTGSSASSSFLARQCVRHSHCTKALERPFVAEGTFLEC